MGTAAEDAAQQERDPGESLDETLEAQIEEYELTPSLHPPSYSRLDLTLPDATTSPPEYVGAASSSTAPPPYANPRQIYSRAQQLDILGLTAHTDLQKALVAGDSQRALELSESPPRSRSLSASLTALTPAAFFGDLDVGLTDLHLAALFGELEVAKAVIQYADIHATCAIQYSFGIKVTALHFAVAARHADMIHFLLESGASLAPAKKKKRTGDRFEYYPPALIMLQPWLELTEPVQPEDCIEVMKTLLSLNWDINTPVDTISRSMLHLAVRIPQERSYLRSVLVDFLLESGAQALSPSMTGAVPLFFAARLNTSPEVVKKLLQHEASDQLAAKDNTGNTALHEAVLSRRSHGLMISIDIIKSLLEAGARVDEKNKKGQTPISIIRDFKGRASSDDAYVLSLLQGYETTERRLSLSLS